MAMTPLKIKNYPFIKNILSTRLRLIQLLSNTNQFRNESNSSIYPTRAVLYVPGSDSKKLTKIFASSADCVVIDCEDGVALNKKQEAREKIRNLYETDKRIQNDHSMKYAVRINPSQTNIALDDIQTIFSGKEAITWPKCLFVPKTNTIDDIKWLYEKLALQLKNSNQFKRLSLFFYVESAISLINLNEIIKSAFNLTSEKYNNQFKLDGLVFGSDDFCADISATRTKDASELMYARQKLITHCKAYKLKAIDMVYIDFKDIEGLKLQSEQGARMGFTGKQVIHPGQVDPTQLAFTPSQDKIDWANGLVQAFDEQQKSGAGAFTYKGQMIDMPTLLQAKNILVIAEKTKTAK